MEEDIENIRRLIRNSKHPSYETTNHKEVIVVCPYCNDGKHKDAGKFYISMTPPFKFHCFRCETSGVLNQQVLRDLEIYDTDLNLSIINSNKNYRSTQGIQHITYRKNTLKNDVTNSEAEQAALNYINTRYISNYSAEFVIHNFKCVLDALEFFKINYIHVNPKITFDFSKAIGFISSDSSHIIFRDITGNQPMRYFNLKLCSDDEITSASKTYNITSNINVMQPKISLVITEGIFDIIGVYTHFKNMFDSNTIFAAACGKAYNPVILKYIRMGFLNLDITIFSDGDVDIDFYRQMKQSSPYLKNTKITIYYNSLYSSYTKENKDFGIPKEKIQLRKAII